MLLIGPTTERNYHALNLIILHLPSDLRVYVMDLFASVRNPQKNQAICCWSSLDRKKHYLPTFWARFRLFLHCTVVLMQMLFKISIKTFLEKTSTSSDGLTSSLYCRDACYEIPSQVELTSSSNLLSAPAHGSIYSRLKNSNIRRQVFPLVKQTIEQNAESSIAWSEASEDGIQSTVGCIQL